MYTEELIKRIAKKTEIDIAVFALIFKSRECAEIGARTMFNDEPS